jgi:hypothetical protein
LQFPNILTLPVSKLWFCPAFWWRDRAIHLIFSVFTSRPTSLTTCNRNSIRSYVHLSYKSCIAPNDEQQYLIQYSDCAACWTTGVRFTAGAVIFLITAPRPALESTQSPIQWLPGVLSPGLKWMGHEADHSPPYSVQVKNAWSCASTPQQSSWRGTQLSTRITLYNVKCENNYDLIGRLWHILSYCPSIYWKERGRHVSGSTVTLAASQIRRLVTPS